MKRYLWWILLPAALSGCTPTENMNGIMASWNGSQIEQVIAQWGYPTEEKEIAGHHLFIWRRDHDVSRMGTATTTGYVSGGQYTGHTLTFGGGTVRMVCTRTLEVDDAGNVVKWQWEGNDCPVLGDNGWTRKTGK